MRRLLMAALITLVAAAPLAAQSGGIAGTVAAEATGEPVAGAVVILRGTTFTTETSADGRYRFTSLRPAAYTLEVSGIGYEASSNEVTVVAGETTTVDVNLVGTAILLEGLTVSTVSRRAEKITQAPATINVIGSERISEHSGGNVGELVAYEKGVDYIRAGVGLTGFNVRGFNSAFNAKNLQMTDGRLSTLISTGLAYGPLDVVTKDDIEQVEILLGPNAALFGPNAHNSVLHTVTKDPRTHEGTIAAIGGGTQSTFNSRLWHGEVLSDQLAFKVSGEYSSGEEYDYTHPVYIGGEPFDEVGLDRDLESIKGGASLYYSPTETSDLVLTYGGNQSNYVAITNAGRNMINDWQIHLLHARFSTPRLFAQVYHTWSNTDSTFAMNQYTQNYYSFVGAGFSDGVARERAFREQWAGPMDGGVALERGALFIDASRRVNGEVQYNNTWNGFNVVVGGQYQRDMADSENTYLLDETQGGSIDFNQVGAYGQVEKQLGDSPWKVLVAARGDDHTRFGFNFMPKAALLHTSDAGTFRATYGKGISAPTILNLETWIFGGLLLGNGEGFTLSDGTEIAPLEVEDIQTVELGYRGSAGKRLFLDLNGYYNFSENFISPTVQLAPEGLSGGPIVEFRGDQPIEELQSGIFQPGDFVLTYVNFGRVDTYGIDLGVNYYFTDNLNLGVNYSWFDFSLDEDDPLNDGNRDGEVNENDLALNTPTHKMSTRLNTNFDRWFGNASLRWTEAYDFFSGINVRAETDEDLIVGGEPVVEGQRVGRDFNEGPLGGEFVFDLGAGFHLTENVTLKGQVINLFDTEVLQFAASPPIGRLFTVEAQFSMP